MWPNDAARRREDMVRAVGAIYFAIYYGLFRFAIRFFDLKTMGRVQMERLASPSSTFCSRTGRSPFAHSFAECTTR